MKKYSIVLIAFLAFACGKDKEILLPRSNKTIVKDVADISPIYMLFATQGKDTLIEVDKQTIISTTNWIFNIDKRFPLKTVIPEVIKLQNRKGSHQGEAEVDNYYSYADSIGKNMAFIPFTSVVYSLGAQKVFAGKWEIAPVLKFGKQNRITCDGVTVTDLQQLPENLSRLYPDKERSVVIFLHFDQNLSYQEYIAAKIAISGWKLQNTRISVSNKEYIY